MGRRVGRSGRGRLLVGGVPVGASVVLERRQLVPHRLEPSAYVADGERGPVGEVSGGGGAVTGQVAPDQLGQCLVALDPARGRHPVVEERVGVHAVSRTTAEHETLQLEVGEQQHEHPSVDVVTGAAERPGELAAGEVGGWASVSCTAAASVARAASSNPFVRSCRAVVRRTRGAVSSRSQPTSSART